MSIEEVINEFRQVPSGFVTDAMTRLGISGWSEGVVPVSSKARRFAGRAVTMKYGPKRGTPAKLPNQYEVIRSANPGDVLVIAAEGTPCWLLGENVCHTALYQGLAAVVVDGCIRDFDEIAELEMPVFARGAGIRPFSTHLELIDVNVPVEFAGAQIRPGDIVVGDGDGIVVVPADRADDVLYQVKDIAVLEKEQEEAIKRQVPLSELNPILARKKILKK
ncbi:MAG: RraA family protein [Sphingomonadaceae bacterium]